MNNLIGIFKFIISIIFFFLGLAVFFLIGDAYSMNYPLFAKISLPIAFAISVNTGIYLLKSGIKTLKRKEIPYSLYTKFSLIIIYISFIFLTLISFFSVMEGFLIEIILINLTLILAGFYDSIKIINFARK